MIDTKSQEKLKLRFAKVAQPDRVVGRILRALPEYFPFESAIVDYCEAARKSKYLTIAAIDDSDHKKGFVMVTMNNDTTAQIWVMAVAPEVHSKGIGSQLLEEAETLARSSGAKYIMVKTVGPSDNNRNFLRTLNFYLFNQYTFLAEFDFVWAPTHCAVLYKKL